MAKGYVYILTNECMLGLVKIGRTVNPVEFRAEQLFTSGVPAPFKVYGEYLCPDCVRGEADAHTSLAAFRVSPMREFFTCDPMAAEDVIRSIQEEQVNQCVREFLPGYVVAFEAKLNEAIQFMAAIPE